MRIMKLKSTIKRNSFAYNYGRFFYSWLKVDCMRSQIFRLIVQKYRLRPKSENLKFFSLGVWALRANKKNHENRSTGAGEKLAPVCLYPIFWSTLKQATTTTPATTTTKKIWNLLWSIIYRIKKTACRYVLNFLSNKFFRKHLLLGCFPKQYP